MERRILYAIVTTVLLSAVIFPAAIFASAQPEFLTEPFLQAPTEDAVTVVWFTEFKGTDHVLVYGEELAAGFNPSEAPSAADGSGTFRVARARSMRLSRMREDERSNTPGDTYDSVTDRQIWRHEAVATGLEPGRRIPYTVVSVTGSGEAVASKTYTLAPKPPAGTPTRILLTSDHQSKAMTPANMQKVEETVGRVDAVFFAGDLVNVPDRASEWFDDAAGGAFFPGLQGTASRALEHEGRSTVYRGGELIQHAPLYPVIGNHEVMGRVHDGGLNSQFNSPVPRDVAAEAYRRLAAEVNPSGEAGARDEWIKNNSFNADTYLELFTLPRSDEGGEMYYAETFGDVRLVSLYATRIWRNNDTSGRSNSAYNEAEANYGDPLSQGWGRHIFEPVKRGSPQYQWLERELSSEEFRSAKYTIVMLHHPVHSLGGNVIPPFTDPVRVVERNGSGEITRIRYEYPKEDNYLIRDLEPLFESAGVDLVFNGHNHVWNRFVSRSGIHYLETSNVGNTYGAYSSGRVERGGIPGSPWSPSNYDRVDDPYGLEPVVPTGRPMTEEKGSALPYLSDNSVTAFSILETGSGTITTYAFDTKDPDSEVWVLDRFRLD